MAEDLTPEMQAEQDFAAAFDEPDEELATGAPAQPAAEDPDSGDADDGGQEPPQVGQAEPVAGEKGETTEFSDLEKKAHGYDSMVGRLQAEQRRAKELEQRLASLEAAQTRETVAPATAPVAVPEAIKDEFEEIKKRDPQIAAIVAEDSKDGARLRKALEEYGVDYVEERAETIRLRRDLEQKLASVEERTSGVIKETAVQTFYGTVGAKHQDWVELATDPSRATEFSAYMGNVRAWAEGKPYSEGARLFKIIEQGTPAEVISLLDSYKQETNQRPATSSKRDAAAALAVPSRSSPPPSRKQAPKDDFDAAFEEAPD